MPLPLSSNPEKLRRAIERAQGSVTRAAVKLGISKTWAMVLVRRHALTAFARRVRRQHGLPVTGRPPRLLA